jgi:predicted RNase H-like nuclease (RuvC/YqgF family)
MSVQKRTSESRENEDGASNRDVTDEQAQSIELVEARLQIMQLRDFAIGEAAKSCEMRVRLQTKEYELAAALTVNHEKNLHIQNHLAHIARLEQAMAASATRTKALAQRSAELDRVYASRTWKLGRLLMLPIRVLKRLLR